MSELSGSSRRIALGTLIVIISIVTAVLVRSGVSTESEPREDPVGQLIAQCRDAKSEVDEVRALRDLANMGPRAFRATELAATKLGSPSVHTRRSAAAALAAFGASARHYIPELERGTRDVDPQVRLYCLRALVRQGDSASHALQSIVARLDDENEQVRGAAVAAVLAAGGAEHMGEIRRRIRDPAFSVRSATFNAIAAAGRDAEAAIPDLIEIATTQPDSEPAALPYAIAATAGVTPSALGALESLSRSQRPGVRAAVAVAIGSLGSDGEPGRPLLSKLASDSEPLVRAAAAEAIDRLTVPRAILRGQECVESVR